MSATYSMRHILLYTAQSLHGLHAYFQENANSRIKLFVQHLASTLTKKKPPLPPNFPTQLKILYFSRSLSVHNITQQDLSCRPPRLSQMKVGTRVGESATNQIDRSSVAQGKNRIALNEASKADTTRAPYPCTYIPLSSGC